VLLQGPWAAASARTSLVVSGGTDGPTVGKEYSSSDLASSMLWDEAEGDDPTDKVFERGIGRDS